MKAEDDCKLERKHSMKLKHAIEQRPSHEVMWEIQQEKELLLAKNQELENTLQVGGDSFIQSYTEMILLYSQCSDVIVLNTLRVSYGLVLPSHTERAHRTSELDGCCISHSSLSSRLPGNRIWRRVSPMRLCRMTAARCWSARTC